MKGLSKPFWKEPRWLCKVISVRTGMEGTEFGMSDAHTAWAGAVRSLCQSQPGSYFQRQWRRNQWLGKMDNCLVIILLLLPLLGLSLSTPPSQICSWENNVSGLWLDSWFSKCYSSNNRGFSKYLPDTFVFLPREVYSLVNTPAVQESDWWEQ